MKGCQMWDHAAGLALASSFYVINFSGKPLLGFPMVEDVETRAGTCVGDMSSTAR